QISNEDYLATNHKSLYESSIPVIQIERPGEPDGSIISWNYTLNQQLAKSKKSKRAKLGLGKKNMVESLTFNFEELFDGLKAALDLTEIAPEDVVSQYLSNSQEREEEQSIEKLLESYEGYETSHYTYRKIHGVSEGENIFINGIVVGRSEADSIVLIARDGILVDILNATVKYHGVEKLGPVDLERVIVKTGLLRKSDNVHPRVLSKDDISISDTERVMYSEEISEDDHSFKVAYVDHAAYDIFKFKDFDLVVTVGDDTSLVASDILHRFNIPIIGITDGDLDKVVESGFVNERSTILEVATGFDDIVGQYIHEELFFSKDALEIPFDEEAASVEEFKTIMFKVFKSRVLEKATEIVPSFVEKDYNYNVINSYHAVVDEKPQIDDNLDDFIDGFESENYNDEEEIYFDEEYDPEYDDEYLEDDVGDISDAELEEIIVEHGSDEYGDEYLEDEIYYDEVPVEESEIESPIEEIYVEHDVAESPVEEIYVEEDVVESPVEEIYVEEDVEEIIYEDAPIEEVYLDEDVEDLPSEEPIEEETQEELEEDDGWAEYIEEEFGDSEENSNDSDSKE
ncbi:DUF2117 domain-containing protein, partial [Methanobrevibacter sp.]|uniref:DUF2117 domain-containing protein n=1 Tax=Methanobrevibacter sp. TaxID=66852 RepID=UPI00388F327D